MTYSQLEAGKPNPTLIDQTRRDITKLEGMAGVQSDKLRQIESLPTIRKLTNAQPIGVAADVELSNYFGVSSTDNLSAIIKRGTIKLSNGFSCFPEGDPLTNNVQNVPPMDGYYDVAMHGSSTMVGFGSTKANMSARLLANVIRHSEGYDGQKIRLLSCYTGQSVDGDYCFAEELANALGVEVMAPNKELYIWPSGEYYVGDDGSGEFVI